MAIISGGKKLEAKLKELAAKLDGKNVLSVGFVEDSTYPDGTSVPLVAYENEYGNPAQGRPPRPFFRNTIADRSDGWGAALARALKDTDMNSHAALERMGEGIAQQIIDTIQAFKDPALAPSTVARKGFDKPLIDTAVMWQTLQQKGWKVEDQ